MADEKPVAELVALLRLADAQSAIAALQEQVRALEADAQRSLEERIAMALDQAGMEQLRAFAHAVMGGWPDVGGLDGFDLQMLGEKHGLLKKEVRTEPCGENCNCADGAIPSDWASGMECFRLTALVKGDASRGTT